MKVTVELSCVQCRDYLIEFTAGSLPPTYAATVYQHLATCATCQRELAAWRTLTDAMGVRDRQTPVDSPARVAAGWARLEEALPVPAISDAREERWGDDEMFLDAMARDELPAYPPISPPSPIPPVPPARRRAVRLRDRLLPALAAVLVISLGAALFGALAHRDHTQPSPVVQNPHPACAPNQNTARLPKGARLARLAMTSPDDGWAVGITYLPGGTTSIASLILHYSHCQWTPEPIRLPGVGFYGISAISANDVWVWGFRETVQPDAAQHLRLTSLLVHYTGGQWHETPFPIAVPDNQIIMGFSMVSAAEGWIQVAQYDDKYGFGPPYQLYHAVNGMWSRVAAPSYHDLWLVKTFTPSEALLIAQQNTSSDTASAQTVLLLYRDGTLTQLYTLPPSVHQPEVGHIQMDGPQDAWITMQTFTTHGAPSGWLLLHCSLSSCSQSSLLDDPRIQASDFVEVFSATEGWAFSSNLPPATPQASPQFSIFRLHDGQWQRLSTAFPVGVIRDIQQVTPDEYWISTTGALLHFANGSWSVYS